MPGTIGSPLGLFDLVSPTRHRTSNKVFLMKKLFNLKMVDSESIAGHLNEFNTLTSQLKSVKVNFEDEIRVLVLLSSLPEAWDGLVIAMSNSYGT